MNATQMTTAQRSAVISRTNITTRCSAKMVAPRATVASNLKSTAFVSSTAGFRAAQPAKLAVSCRAAGAVAVRAEISYVMIKPDGKYYYFCNILTV